MASISLSTLHVPTRMPDPTVSEAVDAVIEAGRRAAAHGWVPATAGNFSVRAGDQLAITRTGRDKGNLQPHDIAVICLEAPAGEDLSAETALHLRRYAMDPAIGAVFHVHSTIAAVMARQYEKQGEIVLQGWEIQKGFAGVDSHTRRVRIAVLSNDQNMRVLADTAEAALARQFDGLTAPGYLVAGHGLNAWGRTSREAQRHLEAFDALLNLQARWSEISP
jgi:methylthioribulose-1-phosphate dehydratase